MVSQMITDLCGSAMIETLERLRGPPVAFLTLALEQGAVGNLLSQDVAELESRDGLIGPAVDEAPAFEEREVVLESFGGGEGTKMSERKLLAEDRGVGRQLPRGGGEAVDARCDEGADGRGHHSLGSLAQVVDTLIAR